MKSQLRYALLAAAGFVLVTAALGVATNFATGTGLDEWGKSASAVSASVAVLSLLVAVVVTFRNQRTISAEEKVDVTRHVLAFKLLQTLGLIEQAALRYVQQQSGITIKRALSLRDVMMIMTSFQVWDSQDQIGFDLATRARNSIAHGDFEQVDTLDLRYAIDKAEQLLEKIRLAIQSEGRSSAK